MPDLVGDPAVRDGDQPRPERTFGIVGVARRMDCQKDVLNGILDVVGYGSTYYGNTMVTVVRGEPGGKFSAVVTIEGGMSAQDVLTPDLNGDGLRDLVLVDEGFGRHYYVLQLFDGTFTTPRLAFLGTLAVDLDSDGDDDPDFGRVPTGRGLPGRLAPRPEAPPDLPRRSPAVAADNPVQILLAVDVNKNGKYDFGAHMKLTVAKYHLPSGRCPHREYDKEGRIADPNWGVTPDRIVDLLWDDGGEPATGVVTSIGRDVTTSDNGDTVEVTVALDEPETQRPNQSQVTASLTAETRPGAVAVPVAAIVAASNAGGAGSVGVQLYNIYKTNGVTLSGNTITGADTGIVQLADGSQPLQRMRRSGLEDPPRPEIPAAITKCRAAGRTRT